MAQHSVDDQLNEVQERWELYRTDGSFERFVEFTLSLNSLAEQLSRLLVPGLVRQCESLENAALALFGDPSTHPIGEQSIQALGRQVEPLLGAIRMARRADNDSERRSNDPTASVGTPEWIKPRSIWMVVEPGNSWAKGLREQLVFYGFRVTQMAWKNALQGLDPPFGVVFVPEDPTPDDARLALIKQARERCPASLLFYTGVPPQIDTMVKLMRAGIDITIQREEQSSTLLSRILDLVQTRQQDRYKVLVVEDSRVAVAQIQRALSQHDIDSESITDPTDLLARLDAYRPDLVLMNMYMPHCNGVEATRALRQIPSHLGVPVVYLSSETDTGLQIEALRLGGDQFLTKPINPVMLAATVKSKIERYREMHRTSHNDGLTGLLSHTAAKARLDGMLAVLPPGGQLCVAMIDLDHFKSVNDTYGHPVGDEVIRSLAWLLKGRLRGTDLIGRYGGEEFILALPDVGPEEAWVVLDRMRRDFAFLPHAHAAGSMRATFSGGIAAFDGSQSSNELINQADVALLEAKRHGRNRIERHLADSVAAPSARAAGA